MNIKFNYNDRQGATALVSLIVDEQDAGTSAVRVYDVKDPTRAVLGSLEVFRGKESNWNAFGAGRKYLGAHATRDEAIKVILDQAPNKPYFITGS